METVSLQHLTEAVAHGAHIRATQHRLLHYLLPALVQIILETIFAEVLVAWLVAGVMAAHLVRLEVRLAPVTKVFRFCVDKKVAILVISEFVGAAPWAPLYCVAF